MSWDGGPTGDGTNFLAPENWLADAIPGVNDTAVLGATGTNPTIIIGGNTVTVQAINTSRDIELNGGTIAGATVTAMGGAQLRTGMFSGTLSGGVTMNADLTIVNLTTLTVTGGLTLNGTVSIVAASGGTRMLSLGTQTLAGSGNVVFNGTAPSTGSVQVDNAGSTLTIGPGITIRTGTRGGLVGSGGSSIVNQGTFSAETAGTTLLVIGDAVTNTGTMSVTAGTFSVINTTAGALANDGTLNIGDGSTFDISGALDGTGNVLAGGALVGNRFRQGSLSISGTATVRSNGTDAATSVLSGLSITGTGKLDLNDNDLILDYDGISQLPAIQGLINSGRNGGNWLGAGITSSSARTNPSQNTTLGAIEATEYDLIYGPGALFNGIDPDDTAVLVKYTYYGDADFNGGVDFDDYVRTDAGFNGGLSGWLNGDFDGSGSIDFDDYVLIDLGFNTQGAVL